MPTKRRRRGRSRRDWLTEEQRLELEQGERGAFESEDEAREAWLLHREDFMNTNPGTRPAGWWRFESPIPRPLHLHPGRVLHEAGLLGEEERAELERYWRRDEEQAFARAESAREYNRMCQGIPKALRREWPGATPEDIAVGEQRGEDPRLFLREALA